MKKFSVALIFVGTFFLACSAQRTETDVSSDPTFSSVVGREFKTKGDFVLFKFRKNDKEIQLDEPGVSRVPYLEEIGRQKFPFEYQGNWILGVLPTGSQFKVNRAILVQGSPSSYVFFDAEITVGKGFEGWQIIPSWLGGGGLNPKMKPELVQDVTEWVGKNK
ncbi:MAG: hypothetical protein IPP68_09895 [Elusimicrobia bacterium]|nr:hypothetical protein [Elusimicrobiota bacterium]